MLTTVFLDVALIASLAAAAVAAAVVGVARGWGRDPLEALVPWSRGAGFEYEPPTTPGDKALIARFVGWLEGRAAAVEIRKARRSVLPDAPARLTTVRVECAAPVFTVQPAAWVVSLDGRPVGEALMEMSDPVDERWAVRGDDAAREWWQRPRLGALVGLGQTVIASDGTSLWLTDPGVLKPAAIDVRLAVLKALAAPPTE